MSLINKMLQELDKRHAVDDGGKPAAPANNTKAKALAQHLRPVKARHDFGEAFWRVMAGLMVVVVCWIAWLLWQITPRSFVTELAFQAKGQTRARYASKPRHKHKWPKLRCKRRLRRQCCKCRLRCKRHHRCRGLSRSLRPSPSLFHRLRSRQPRW